MPMLDHAQRVTMQAIDRGPRFMPEGLFAGQPEASEAVYRLSRAARDGRPASEDIRLIGGLGGSLGGGSKAVWYRVAVRALPEIEGGDKPLVLWSVEYPPADDPFTAQERREAREVPRGPPFSTD